MDMSDAVIVNSSRLKSIVWNDFDRVKKGDTFVAICRHCKKKLSGSSTSGTSHLRNHLIRCQRRSSHGVAQYFSAREKKKEGSLALVTIDQEQKKDEVLSIMNLRYEQEQIKNEHVGIGSNSLDQRRSQFDLARMIILHNYPLAMVEHAGFKIFVRNLQPLFELVTCNKVEADCMEIYAKEKQKVHEIFDKLPGKISVSADMWTASDGSAAYLSLAAHYIDEDWQLKKKILNFVTIDPSYAEDMHSEVIMNCLMDWDIDRKLFSMIFDSFTGENIVDRIRDRLSQNRFLYCNGQLFDVRCAIDLLSRMAHDALEALCEVTQKIRESICYVKSSEATHATFNELADEVQVETKKCLSIDNPLKWNSTYFMLEVALEYRKVFSCLRDRDPVNMKFLLSDLEWDRLSTITSFLKLFVEVTNVFSRSKYPTANIFFPEICDIHLQLIEWCKDPDESISSLALKMRKKFEEYWDKCNVGLAVAAMLDPRFKMKLLEYYYPQLYGDSASVYIDEVFECIKSLYNEHSIVSPLASSIDQGLDWQANGIPSSSEDSRDRLMGFDKFVHETSQAEGSNSDLDKYLEEPLFPRNNDFNVLNWWKVHTPRYPILSMMARNILGIPISKVASESRFDTQRRVLDHNWSLLPPITIQALMCAQDWIQSELES
ncbi:DAYSLEEPER [Hibiscus trionum]|uniref:DAYSLEEPER n=1 Tax=Hibiscus trionum TaxID=183268 RepID=A0A9W7M417_HIBTR|nr:DAYSLEEPER [Hibiscus trionum]